MSVVYNCFSAEMAQAMTGHRDVDLGAVLKVGTQVTVGSFPE